ncbi:hypothetical protein KOW79_011545 [Hemibagrus wyckioides]|uniref:Uncharacterized protein n=1 Tax=Hemibagrus wyckioides TaxID=337641 RepID=A0A9D3NNI8_9TELE|nr:hypothetical protein KOW79_011545 [Hemibagrus wyckioides]
MRLYVNAARKNDTDAIYWRGSRRANLEPCPKAWTGHDPSDNQGGSRITARSGGEARTTVRLEGGARNMVKHMGEARDTVAKPKGPEHRPKPQQRAERRPWLSRKPGKVQDRAVEAKQQSQPSRGHNNIPKGRKGGKRPLLNANI